MTPYDKASDEIYIGKLRKSLESRMTVAFLYVLVGILIFGTSIYYGKSLYEEMVKYVGFLQAEDAKNMSNSDFAKISAKSNFYFGIGIGAALTAALSAGIMLIANAVLLLFGGRKEKMLIHYYEKSTKTHT
jgi:hypothetical protein